MSVGDTCGDCGCPLTGNERHADYDDLGDLCGDCFWEATRLDRRCHDCGKPAGRYPWRVHRDGDLVEVCSDCS